MAVDFSSLERSAWSDPTVARAYTMRFPSVTGFTIPALLRGAAQAPGAPLLDIACGPGTVTRQVDPSTPVTSLDFSRAMLSELGRGGWNRVQGSALSEPFRNAAFASVVCNFGLLHFPDPDRALVEGLRVLRPGGRAAWSVWGEDAVAFQLIPGLIRELGWKPSLPPGPDFFRYGSLDRFSNALETRGYQHVRTERLEWRAEFRSPGEFWVAFSEGSARTRAAIRSLSEVQRRELQQALTERLLRYRDGDGLRVPTTAIVGSGGTP